MDEEQVLFQQLILNELKKESSTGLKTFNNYSMIMNNNNANI